MTQSPAEPPGALGNCTLYDAVFGTDLPDSPAIISGNRSFTYAQLGELIDDAAANLHAAGIRAHQVVGIQLGNSAEFAILFHAVAKLGAVVSPLGMHVTDGDRTALLRAADAALLVGPREVEALLRPRSRALPRVEVSPDDLACLPFSSGTTGSPKAIMLPHRSLAANVQQFGQVLPLAAGATCLSVLPFSHIYGLTALLNVPLALRARVIAQDYQADSFLAAHEQYGVNLTFIAPPLATLLARHPSVASTDFSELSTIVSGAAPLNAQIAAQAEERVGARIIEGFGLTEASPVTHLSYRQERPLGSIGWPIPGTSISVRDPETGAPARRGEMWVQGPQVMRGYLGDPEATERALVDGWLRTGDLVEAMPDGSYAVIDRLKDVIKSHGFQVSPVKLERLLMRHEAIFDAAVARGFGPDGEERPEAWIVSDGSLTAAEVMGFIADRVARYERVRAVHFVPEIPRSAAGKILRRQLPSA